MEFSDGLENVGGPYGRSVTVACEFGWETPRNGAVRKSSHINPLKTKK